MNRREIIKGLISFVAAPAIVRVDNIMPVKVVRIWSKKEMIEAVINAQITGVDEILIKAFKNTIIYGSGGFGAESIADNIVFTPVHNYLKLD